MCRCVVLYVHKLRRRAQKIDSIFLKKNQLVLECCSVPTFLAQQHFNLLETKILLLLEIIQYHSESLLKYISCKRNSFISIIDKCYM